MSRYAVDGRNAVEPIALTVGDRVRLDWDADQWWTVQAVTEHYAACTRPLTQAERDEYSDDEASPVDDGDGPLYTVLDWRNGVRGPCDLIGQGWGNGTYGPEECAAMLVAFEVTDADIHAAFDAYGGGSVPSHLLPLRVEVSQRNWAPLKVVEHQAVALPGR